ncbi:MAG: Rrf2 family transcriptional regulator [Desulfomicrobium escambiense]|nr:Rrf2 family transcriptional regulator [Desulfomicrobium escambiense]
MQRLVKFRLIDSIRGPKGGFSLAKSAENITLLEVYEAIEGPIAACSCLLGEQKCKGKNCAIFDKLIVSIDKQVRDYLTNKTLAELVKTLD